MTTLDELFPNLVWEGGKVDCVMTLNQTALDKLRFQINNERNAGSTMPPALTDTLASSEWYMC